MAGVRKIQPNLRNVPFVIDPFAIKNLDTVVVTHIHQGPHVKELAAHVVLLCNYY